MQPSPLSPLPSPQLRDLPLLLHTLPPLQVPDGTVLSCFQKGYRMAARKPGSALSSSGEGDDAEGAAAMEVDSGTDSGSEEGAAPPGMLVRPALVKVSMQ